MLPEKCKVVINSEVKKKVVIVGDSHCGKSSLISAFTKNHFPEGYNVTCFDTDNVAKIEVTTKQMYDIGIAYLSVPFVKRKRIVKLSLFDTGGQEAFNRIRRLAYPDTDIVIMCFSIGDPRSFDNITENWAPEIRHFCPDVPIILVGNKKDQRHDPDVLKVLQMTRQEPVKLEAARKLARKVKAVNYLESSAKYNEGVIEIFQAAAKAAFEEKTKRCKRIFT